VPGRSEFAASVYAAVRARDRGAIGALSPPDIVVGTTVEAYRGPPGSARVMMGTAETAVVDLGVPAERVHTKRFDMV